MQPDAATSFRLSPQQERLWSVETEPTGRSVGRFLISGTVDAPRLRDALLRVVARHEILRTTFQRRTGMRLPFQTVHDDLPPDWQEHDVASLTGAEQQRRIDELVAEAESRPWNLAEGPLTRALLITLGPDRSVFVLTIAAVCADAASVLTVARETVAHYSGAAVAGDPLQYADFAEWQHELLASEEEDAAAAAAFWAGEAEAPAVAVPFLGPGVGGIRESLPLELGTETVAAIQAAADRYGVSADVFAESAFRAVLALLSGADEVAIARVSRGRHHEELEPAVGAFSRPVSLRTPIPTESRFSELLVKVGHADDEGARWLDYAPAPEHLPVGFSSGEAPGTFAAGDLVLATEALAGDEARADLELDWLQRGDAAEARLWFDAQALPAVHAERLARHVERVLAQAAASPEVRLDELELLDAEDVRRLTVDANPPAVAAPEVPVHRRFAAAAARAPEHPAVVDGTGSIAYGDLEARANRLANHLRAAGVGPDVVVGLCTDRSVDMAVGVLGILKAGGAYLPLNFEHPEARVDHQLRETNAPVLVTQEAILPRLPAFAGTVVCLDRDRAVIDTQADEAPEPAEGMDGLAYVIYTSGSTGLPKGVGVTHANLASYVAAIADRLDADREPLSFGMVTAISTDLGNTAFFPSLATGGTLVLVPPVVAADGAAMAAFGRRHPIDVLKITPSHLNALLVGAEAASVLPRRWLVCGGEALSWDTAARVRELGTCKLLNHYGPTETTIGSSTFLVETDGPGRDAPATVPIGIPLAGSACYVLDGKGRPVPEGVVGELSIGGAGVARGYVGQPEATAERFRPDPFAAGAGARMYTTGDRARRLSDGTIEFLGRADDQIKIRGFRVEPAEIEAALRRIDGVEDAVVVAREEGQGDRRLVAYVVAARQVPLEELRSGTGEWVPDFMVPSAFVVLDSFPRTASGKVDRLSLPAPEEAVTTGHAYVAPRTPTEEAVAAIWASVLGVERVGVEDDFFAIGGHSLLATQIVAQIRSDFSVNLPLHALFSSPTVAALSEQVVALMGEGQDSETEALLAELEGLSDEEAERLLAGDARDEG